LFRIRFPAGAEFSIQIKIYKIMRNLDLEIYGVSELKDGAEKSLNGGGCVSFPKKRRIQN
jgi:hypothetical protein